MSSKLASPAAWMQGIEWLTEKGTDDVSCAKGSEGRRWSFQNARGIHLAAYTWPATGVHAWARVLLLHGHGGYACYEYLKSNGKGSLHTYEGSWVEKMNNEGMEVHAFDIQSHGQSDGVESDTRCYFESFDDLVQDAILFTEKIRNQESSKNDLPLFLVGMSMGGCLATLTAHTKPEYYRGVCLLCPMLSLEKQKKTFPNNVLLLVSRAANAIVPRAKLGKIGKNEKFPDLQEEFEEDELTFEEKPRVRVALEYVNATSLLVQEMPNINFPFIIFQSAEDTFVDKAGSEELFSKACSADKTLKFLENRCHFIIHEPGNEEILQEMIAWFKERSHPQ